VVCTFFVFMNKYLHFEQNWFFYNFLFPALDYYTTSPREPFRQSVRLVDVVGSPSPFPSSSASPGCRSVSFLFLLSPSEVFFSKESG